MHIVNIMLSRTRGGLEQSAADYAEMLRQRHMQVTSIVSSECFYLEKIKNSSGKTFLLDNKNQWDLFAIRRLKAILRTAKPDAIICHGNRAISIARRAKKSKTPLIAVTHNTKIKALKKADAVFAVTKNMHNFSINHGVKINKLHYVPNMADIPMQPTPYKHPQNPLIIGSLGRLSYEKGIDVLIDAFALLQEDTGLPDMRLHIGGDGSEYKALVKQVKKNGIEKSVKFEGWIEQRDIFLRKLDIYCLPSRRETFGISLVEAMARGVICIAANCDGPQEILTHNKDGFLISSNNPQVLADTIRSIIEKKEDDRKALGIHAFSRASDYNIATVSAALSDALHKVIEN